MWTHSFESAFDNLYGTGYYARNKGAIGTAGAEVNKGNEGFDHSGGCSLIFDLIMQKINLMDKQLQIVQIRVLQNQDRDQKILLGFRGF